MRIFLPVLCVLCATPVRSVFDGGCPRKDPLPGGVVLSPGSSLVLTCSGHVKVDGVKVRSNTGSSSRAVPTTVNNISNNGVSMKGNKHTMEISVSKGYHSNPTEAGQTRSLGHTDAGYTASPTTHMVKPTSVSRLQKGESNQEAQETDGEGDYEDEEEGGEEGSRVTRGIKSRSQWKWNGRTVGEGDRDWGEITVRRRTTLSLSSVRLTDSGRYTCYYKGKQRFSLEVTVADLPENPSLSCYKKSPSSKIRCEWTPQKNVTILPKCSLVFRKNLALPFQHLPCSYSCQRARWWCVLGHNEDELRTPHMAFLYVLSIAGNASSTPLHFTPLSILKPDPPSHVSVPEWGKGERRMTVTWRLPTSWKSQDHYYDLIYEVKYKPLMSSVHYEQIQAVKGYRSYTITDAMPGVEYLIQVRTKDEFDGLWSDWSTPVCASSWKAQTTITPWMDELDTMTSPVSTEDSGSGDYVPDGDVSPTVRTDVPYHILWMSGSFALLSVILAAYIFRHKDRLMSKLHSVTVVTQYGDSPHPPPSAPTSPEGQALVTFSPPHYKEPPPSQPEKGEEENEEEQQVKERTKAMHFNNTSYFFLQQKGE